MQLGRVSDGAGRGVPFDDESGVDDRRGFVVRAAPTAPLALAVVVVVVVESPASTTHQRNPSHRAQQRQQRNTLVIDISRSVLAHSNFFYALS